MEESKTDSILDEMQLPKVNERKQQSYVMLNGLKLFIKESIKEFEDLHDYEFERYEIDSLLLDMVQRNHTAYLISKFGHDQI